MEKRNVLVYFFALVASISLASAININGCQDIISSGTYTLSADITVAPSGADYHCLNINANNVVLDGNGYKLIGYYNSSTGAVGTAININFVNGTTVKNFNINNFGYAISTYGKSNNVSNNTITQVYNGITVGGLTNTISKNNVSNAFLGLSIIGSDRDTISDNLINNVADGIYIYHGANFSIRGNSIFNSSIYGVFLVSSGNLLYNNTIAYGKTGIITFSEVYYTNGGLDWVYEGGMGNNISSNKIIANNGTGIVINTNNNTVSNNNISFNFNYAINITISTSDLSGQFTNISGSYNMISNNFGLITGFGAISPASSVNGNVYLNNFNPIGPLLVHPADTDSNFNMNTSESTKYNLFYKTQQAWPTPPSPPNSSYNTRANILWKLGGVYHLNTTANCPSAGPAACWLTGS